MFLIGLKLSVIVSIWTNHKVGVNVFFFFFFIHLHVHSRYLGVIDRDWVMASLFYTPALFSLIKPFSVVLLPEWFQFFLRALVLLIIFWAFLDSSKVNDGHDSHFHVSQYFQQSCPAFYFLSVFLCSLLEHRYPYLTNFLLLVCHN